MKLPNRTGTICRLSGNRRKPYMVRIYTTHGYSILGYYRLRSEAQTALMTAVNRTIASPQSPNATLAEVYAMWSAKHYQTITAGSQYQYEQAWRTLHTLHNRPIRHITVSQIESAVESSHTAPSVRNTAKSLLNQVYATAMRYDLADRNLATLIDIELPVPHTVTRKVFTFAEVTELFNRQQPIDKAILIAIYSGMRPGELLALDRTHIDLGSGCFRIPGSKTKSGLNRVIPIHPAILSMVTELTLKPGKFMLTTNHNKPLRYGTYKTALSALGHTPHDTRHTFASYAHKSGMDELAVKRILGHHVAGITEAVYTHLDEAFLKREMSRFAVL